MPDSVLLTKLAALPPPRGGDEPSLMQWIRESEQLAGHPLFARDTTGMPIVLAGWLGMAGASLIGQASSHQLITELVKQPETVWWNELEAALETEGAPLHRTPQWALAWTLAESGSLPTEQVGDLALVAAALQRDPQAALQVWNWMVQAADLENVDLSWMVIGLTELPRTIPPSATWTWWRMYARLTALMVEGAGLVTAERHPLCPDRIVQGIVDAVQQGRVAPSLASEHPKPYEQLQLGVIAYLSAGRGHDVDAALAVWEDWRNKAGTRWTDEAVRLVGDTELVFRLRYDRSGRMGLLADIAERLFDNADATREWLLGYRGWKRFKQWREQRVPHREDRLETIQMGMLLADDFPGWPHSHIDLNVEHERGLPLLVDVGHPNRRLDPALAERLWSRRPGSSHRPLPTWIWMVSWALGRHGSLPIEWLDLDAESLWMQLWASPAFRFVLQQLPDAEGLLQLPAPRSTAILGLPAHLDRHGLQVQRLSPVDPLTLVLGIFSDCCQHIFNELAYLEQVAQSPDGAYLVVRDGAAIIAQGILYATAGEDGMADGRLVWVDTLEMAKNARRSPRLTAHVESAVWAYLGRSCAALELRGIAPCMPIIGRLHEAPTPLPSWTVPFIEIETPAVSRSAVQDLIFVEGLVLESAAGYFDPGAALFVPDARIWLFGRPLNDLPIDRETIVAAMNASTPSYWRGFVQQLLAFPEVSVTVALAVGAAWATRFGFPGSWQTLMELARGAEHPGFRAAIQQRWQIAEEKGTHWQEAVHPWRDMLDTLVLAAQATVPATLEEREGTWLLTVPSESHDQVLWAWSPTNERPPNLKWYEPREDGPLLYKIAATRL